MDDQFYKTLKYIAILLIAGFIAFSIYDGLIKGKDNYTLAMGAGHRYFEDGQYRDAITEFKSALEIRPGDPPANYGIAISQMQLGSNELALQFFSLAIEAEQDNKNKAFYFANRGILYDRMGQYQKALDDYKRALTLEPETAEGPGIISRLLHNQPEKPPTIADRARYLQAELAKPESERLLSVPEIDEQQRSEKVQ